MINTDEFKAILSAELSKITADLKTIAIKDPISNDWIAVPIPEELVSADPNEEADGVEEWNERRATLAQLEVRYRNIKRALEKINDGVYGLCEISGEPIEIERLQANPAARTNIANMDREKELAI